MIFSKFILIVVVNSFLFRWIHCISEPCSAGTYRSAEMTSCETCEEGSISSEGESSCKPCSIGHQANLDNTQCGLSAIMWIVKFSYLWGLQTNHSIDHIIIKPILWILLLNILLRHEIVGTCIRRYRPGDITNYQMPKLKSTQSICFQSLFQPITIFQNPVRVAPTRIHLWKLVNNAQQTHTVQPVLDCAYLALNGLSRIKIEQNAVTQITILYLPVDLHIAGTTAK